MMEPVNLGAMVSILSAFGPYGLVLMMWYIESSKLRKEREEHKKEQAQNNEERRKELESVMRRYEQDMADTRMMYENNVNLVKATQDIASDLKELVIMNSAGFTTLSNDVRSNQYCPLIRVEKKHISVGAGE